MNTDVVCTYCGATYDLGAVTVLARYSDATTFKTPCCGHEADDREWLSLPSFTRVERVQRIRSDGSFTDGLD